MVVHYTNYLKLLSLIPCGPTISVCSLVCFDYIKFVASALSYKEKCFIKTALIYIKFINAFNLPMMMNLLFYNKTSTTKAESWRQSSGGRQQNRGHSFHWRDTVCTRRVGRSAVGHSRWQK